MAWLSKIIIQGIPILLAIIFHEVAHGLTAYYLGDDTAKRAGRLSLNPIMHIDPIGTLAIPGVLLAVGSPFLFGWAKPVPVLVHRLRRPRRDMALVSAAGPLANFLMALVWAVLLKTQVATHASAATLSPSQMLFVAMAQAGVMINIVLMMLNLLPIPPLDGSRIIASFFSPRVADRFLELEQYGFFIVFILMAAGVLSFVLRPLVYFGLQIVKQLTGL